MKIIPSGPDRKAVIENWQVVLNHIMHRAMYDTDGAQSGELIQIVENLRRVVQLSYIDHSKMGSGNFDDDINQGFDLLRGSIDKHFSARPVERIAANKAVDGLQDVLRKSKDRVRA